MHRLERLSERLGGKVKIWAKREDCNSALAYVGNKTWKLEYLVADPLAQGCDTLVLAAQASQSRLHSAPLILFL